MKQPERLVYVDNSATTQITQPVLDAMMPYLATNYGNPSSIYRKGREAAQAIETAREQVAKAIGATVREVFFTSGATEADNWAIRSTAHRLAAKGKKHIITTAFEHHAVLHTVQQLVKEGFDATYLPVGTNGVVKVQDVADAIRDDTALVTIIYANNEIGTIQPISEIGALCRERGVIFHTDAVQAIGNIPVNVVEQNIDLLALSGHKFHAPKGVGAIYVRKGIPLPTFMLGGGQERGRRAGTENVAGIVGMGKAIELATANIEEKQQRLLGYRERLIDGLLKVERSHLNGDRNIRLAGNANISFEGIEGESLLLMLDMYGIEASSGSACTSGSLDPSHVLLALGRSHEVAHGSLRLTLSEATTDEDIEYILKHTPPIVEKLRDMSPLWEQIVKGNYVIS